MVLMVKVMKSTNATQGDYPGDYSFVPEGELVARYDVVCAKEQPDGIGGCGCGRGFGGLDTHTGTTTAVVADSDMSREQWREAMHKTLVDTGWGDEEDADETAELLDELEMIDLDEIQQYPTGTLLRRVAYNKPNGITSDTLLFTTP